MAYKFKLLLTYDLESDEEEDAVYELADLIKRDWPSYIDEGTLTKVTKTGRRSRAKARPRKLYPPLSVTGYVP